MHGSVWLFSNLFFTWCHVLFEPNVPLQVVDIGSYDWNGNLRTAVSHSELNLRNWNYTGVDIEEGPNVDVVLHRPYEAWPFDSNSIDIVMTCSALEHDKFFWLTFLNMVDILKPGGFLLFMVPSNIPSHRYPVDSWRFLEDASDSLLQWARHNKHDLHMVHTDIYPHERLHSGAKPPDSVYTDSISIYWKSDFQCTGNPDAGDCTTQADSYNTAKADHLRKVFFQLAYSFLRNMRKLGQVGSFAQPAEIASRIAHLESTHAQLVTATADPVGIQQNAVWLDQILCEYIICSFRVPVEAIVPTPAPNARYIAFPVTFHYAKFKECRLTRAIMLTAENLTHRELLEEAAAEFAHVFKLRPEEIQEIADAVWNIRAELLEHLQVAR